MKVSRMNPEQHGNQTHICIVYGNNNIENIFSNVQRILVNGNEVFRK